MQRSKSTSPAKISAANYESAAKDIEQEKRMVAALKRLSFGHLLNTDPDIPAPDSHFSFVVDNQGSDSYSDSYLSPSRSSSSSSGAHGSPEKNISQSELEFYDSESNFEPHASETDVGDYSQTVSTPADVGYGEETLWVPANIHPEINPQQFKNHVQTTIGELLERKISRSKSASRSKRSSLSLSTTDHLDDDESDSEAVNTSFNSDSMNPSLSELSSELQVMSRLAGMDSTDAVTLARSLSSSTIGYSDVEKLAFDKLGNVNYSSPQAEMLDLGEEPSQQHSSYSDDSSTSSRASYKQSSSINGSFDLNSSPHEYRRPTENFTLKRSRRLDYRKNPSSSSLGSQLQHGKANKLAELRNTLNNSLSNELTNGAKSPPPKKSSRNSVQSYNPRNSQVLFSYKKSSSKSSSKSNPKPADTISMVDFASKDSPYLTTSSAAVIEQNIHPTKYGQRKLTPKAYGISSGPPPQHQPSPHQKQHRSSSRESSSRKPISKSPSPQVVPKRKHEISSRESSKSLTREDLHHRSSPDNIPYLDNSTTRGSPAKDHRTHDSTRKIISSNDKQHYKGSSQYPHQNPQRDPKPSDAKFDERISGVPSFVKAKSTSPHVPSNDRFKLSEHDYSSKGSVHKYKGYRAREKTKELNQNLDLFRDELNDFKEKLNKSEKQDLNRDKTIAGIQKDNDLAAEQQDFSFDLTSHDISYDDSLGIEKDVLGELRDAQEKPDDSVKPDREGNAKFQAGEPDERQEEPNSISFRAISDSRVPDNFYSRNHVEKDRDDQETAMGLKNNATSNIEHTEVTDHQQKEETVMHPVSRLHVPEEESEKRNKKKSSHDKPEKIPSKEYVEAKGKEVPEQVLDSNASSEPTRNETSDKKKSKKTWLWSKEKQQDKSLTGQQQQTSVATPLRSVSSPEISHDKKSVSSVKEESASKENVITKLFKKKRSSSVSQEKSARDSSPRNSVISSGDGDQEQASLSRASSHNSAKSQKRRKSSSEEVSEAEVETKSIESVEERKPSDGSKKSRLKNKIKSMTKIHEEKSEKTLEAGREAGKPAEEVAKEEGDSKPKSTLEVQERLKKSIRRTSKANQPIEFTDSAFGFPLPPPSTSTLVMIDYRFPVHVERAIYRLSHLKLANPKRSLREQVLLSNFMYAYLNLVDHTLHLEQQMSSEDYEVEQPEQDANLLGDRDVDTDIEVDSELEGENFETIKIDLDVNAAA